MDNQSPSDSDPPSEDSNKTEKERTIQELKETEANKGSAMTSLRNKLTTFIETLPDAERTLLEGLVGSAKIAPEPQIAETEESEVFLKPQQSHGVEPEKEVFLKPQQSHGIEPEKEVFLKPQQSHGIEPEKEVFLKPQQSHSVEPEKEVFLKPQQSHSVEPEKEVFLKPQQSHG